MSAARDRRLTPRQVQAVAALLDEPSIVGAAARIGVNEKTIRVWLTDRDFIAALNKAGMAVLQAAKARLQTLTEKSVTVLAADLDGERAGDRLRACELVLSHAVKLCELLDLTQRVEDLETAAEKDKLSRNGRYPSRT
jgi:hypothetical protein